MPMVRLFLGKEFYQMFRWFNEAGFQADIAAGLSQQPFCELVLPAHIGQPLFAPLEQKG